MDAVAKEKLHEVSSGDKSSAEPVDSPKSRISFKVRLLAEDLAEDLDLALMNSDFEQQILEDYASFK